jgi:uncharacterized membrane protein
LRLVPLIRGLFSGGRLALCVVAGGAVFVALPPAWPLGQRLALAWVLAVLLFLLLTLVAVGRASPDQLRQRARRLDARRWVILAIIVAGAGASLLALGFVLQKAAGETTLAAALRLVLAGLAVLASWTLTHVTFALHYAHSYYGDLPRAGSHHRGGLAFPGGGAPDFWDFVYFAFVVGMTCQVSDVQVTSRGMRRLTLVHGVVAFFFNTVILALAVNLLASSL